MSQRVKLSTIISDMNTFQTMQTIEEDVKVRFLDQAIKNDSAGFKLPFRLKKSTLRVFDGVRYYAFPEDYDELAYVDNDEKDYANRARFKFNSYNEFEEDKDYRNDLAEIYDNGDVVLGCRYRTKRAGSQILDDAENVSVFSVSGDATAAALDQVFFKEGNASIRVTVVLSSGTATISNTFSTFTDTLYQRKYVFRLIYLSGVPDSIALRFGNSATAYLYQANITTQFDGRPLRANAWNLVAFDLNTASTIGSFSSTGLAYEAIIMTNAPSGTYYVDSSYLRTWELLENFDYFSRNAVTDADGNQAETFIDPETEDYDAADYLIGPREWANFLMFRAMILALGDKTDNELYVKLAGIDGKGGWAREAEEKVKSRYPSVKYAITNSNWRFRNNLMSGYEQSNFKD